RASAEYRCVCPQTMPGITYLPDKSKTGSSALGFSRRARSMMTPCLTRRSARSTRGPLNSSSVALVSRIATSRLGGFRFDRRHFGGVHLGSVHRPYNRRDGDDGDDDCDGKRRL